MARPTTLRHRLHRAARQLLAHLPRDLRFAIYRRLIDCDPAPDARLQLGIARTKADFEACFALLHDAYVDSGFMAPDPSGLRVTPYHALPTTTTLYARWDGEIVGTLSLIREGVFGFPLQTVFDLTRLRAQPGQIAEVSALAIAPRFRNRGGVVLFPLMKFMYEYCTNFFDTRHLVIAVNPNRIELYESLLFFQRLQAHVVDSYDFANGAPAVGATLDLTMAPEIFRAFYGGRSPHKDLHRYFTGTQMPNIHFPDRTYFTTNDPVMSPALLDHFFNQRTRVFAQLDERKRQLLHAIYTEPAYRDVLPTLASPRRPIGLRRHRRHSMKCPAQLELHHSAAGMPVPIEVVDLSLHGFLARTRDHLYEGDRGHAYVALGAGCHAQVAVEVVRFVAAEGGPYYGFHIGAPDEAWQRCIADLEGREAPHPISRALAAPEPVAATDWCGLEQPQPA